MIPLARSLQILTRTTDLQLRYGAFAIIGWSFRETTNAAGATVELYDGSSTGDNLLTSITLATNESTRDFFSITPLIAETGVFLHVVAGSIKGAVWGVPAEELGVVALERGLAHVWAGEQ